jgi:hypothetical protein
MLWRLRAHTPTVLLRLQDIAKGSDARPRPVSFVVKELRVQGVSLKILSNHLTERVFSTNT